ncbi:MAG TPA: TlpA disulfide reductase family protein [Pyrinomonadaceae bacterium]|jgi:thiol-disulfide isomerase/thioredoxin|nr:TlpA disulfide reductase family protein [Pyrinomonadaceae bacterium]
MRTTAITIAFAALIAGSSCRPAAAPVAVSNRPVSVNDRPMTKAFIEMSWTDENGRIQSVSDLGGKAVILDFWATNCPPCVKEIPKLMALRQKYGADNVQLIGLHVGDDEDRAKIAQFSKLYQLDYPIAFPESDLSRFVFSDGDEIPRTIVLDRKGRILARTVGFSDEVERRLDAAVAEAVSTN